jgi:predicted RecA/RadA family phage recombinase
MKNFHQPGDVLTLIAPGGGVVSGNFYQIGGILVCATHDAAAGEEFTGKTTGVYRITKVAGTPWAQGALVYFDASTQSFSTSAVGNVKAGIAVAAADSAATGGLVRLDGVSLDDDSGGAT